MAFASWGTIGRRCLMIACGKCSPAEYSRKVLEKMAATNHSASLLARSEKSPRVDRHSGPLARSGHIGKAQVSCRGHDWSEATSTIPTALCRIQSRLLMLATIANPLPELAPAAAGMRRESVGERPLSLGMERNAPFWRSCSPYSSQEHWLWIRTE